MGTTSIFYDLKALDHVLMAPKDSRTGCSHKVAASLVGAHPVRESFEAGPNNWQALRNEKAPREAGLLQVIARDQLLLAMISAITPVAAATIRNWPSSLRTQR